ncbi:hypothetical protein GE061_009015 [Apolygus lucorum]|uniref:Uncharacterized protein n=1 Tax=Apolygus lucorum TaxID=248454 RepID=A0A8S9Y365_APOLU|nr:hypothetical protein GE061_009015 [Apolygus lucorum]
MCNKMYKYCRKIYDEKSWWSKLLALVVILCYFVAVVMIHDQPYLWLTLTFAVILCLTTLACSRDDPIIAFRRGGPTPRASISEEREHPLEIWVTDVPPTYSFIMANATPPPSYGSAIFKFPAVAAAAAEKLEKSEGLTNASSTPMLRRVLDPSRFRSVSRQVSEIGRLSRQVSESGIGRLSRQSSINASEIDASAEDWESGIVIIVPPRLRRTISQNSDAFVATRSSEENDSGPKQDTAEAHTAEPAAHEAQANREISSAVFTCSTDGTKRTVIVVNVTDFCDRTEDSESLKSGTATPSKDVKIDVESECESEPALPDRSGAS